MVGDGAFSDKIDFITIFQEILNLKGHYMFKSYGDFAEWMDFAYWWPRRGVPRLVIEKWIDLNNTQHVFHNL